MIAIDKVLLSDDVVQEQFVCDLNSCKGGCCVDGDCGAPLTKQEASLIAVLYPKVKEYLPKEHIDAIAEQGMHTMDDEHGYVTPTIDGGICVYGYTDEFGIVKCGIERAWKDGKIDFQKPISCHLYPIRITEYKEYDAVNYEPRETLCKPACTLGERLKVPVYIFLKDALIRKYGEEFYEALDATAKQQFGID